MIYTFVLHENIFMLLLVQHVIVYCNACYRVGVGFFSFRFTNWICVDENSFKKLNNQLVKSKNSVVSVRRSTTTNAQSSLKKKKCNEYLKKLAWFPSPCSHILLIYDLTVIASSALLSFSSVVRSHESPVSSTWATKKTQ